MSGCQQSSRQVVNALLGFNSRCNAQTSTLLGNALWLSAAAACRAANSRTSHQTKACRTADGGGALCAARRWGWEVQVAVGAARAAMDLLAMLGGATLAVSAVVLGASMFPPDDGVRPTGL